MGNTRRKLEIKLPVEDCFVDLTQDKPKFYKEAEKVEEISNKGGSKIEISIPRNIENLETLEVRKSMLPPIVEAGINREIWPKGRMVGLRLIMDNRDINMVDDSGEFRREKYIQLYQCTAWKRWVILVYTRKDSSKRAIMWWKK